MEFITAAARAALGLGFFAELPHGRSAQIAISDALTATPLDVMYVFHVGLLARPVRTDTLPLKAPAPEALEPL